MKSALALLVSALATGQTVAAGLDWAKLEPLQKSPIAFGVRVDGGYKLQDKHLSYGLAAELLFPLVSTARARAQVVKLTIEDGNASRLVVNYDLSLDVLVAWPLRRMLAYPYACAGAGLVMAEQSTSYALRAGLGVEGNVARLGKAFAELGLHHAFCDTAVTQAIVGVGFRFGR